MKPRSEIKEVMWLRDPMPPMMASGLIDLPGKVRGHIIVGWDEEGWEHVSVELLKRRLPTWEEMAYIKDIFFYPEEEAVQIHPKASEYVNITEALHIWRPKNGDWSIMNHDDCLHSDEDVNQNEMQFTSAKSVFQIPKGA